MLFLWLIEGYLKVNMFLSLFDRLKRTAIFRIQNKRMLNY